jgi:hypothetical protein
VSSADRPLGPAAVFIAALAIFCGYKSSLTTKSLPRILFLGTKFRSISADGAIDAVTGANLADGNAHIVSHIHVLSTVFSQAGKGSRAAEFVIAHDHRSLLR